MRNTSIGLTLAAALLLASLAQAQGVERGTIRVDAKAEINSVGDIAYDIQNRFHPADYVTIKQSIPNPFLFLRELGSNRADTEIGPEPSCVYNDAKNSVMIKATQLGTVRNEGNGEWLLRGERGLEFINIKTRQDGRYDVHFYNKGDLTGTSLPYSGQMVTTLPPKASDPKWDNRRLRLTYKMPTVPGGGRASLKAEMHARERFMATTYKVYGLGVQQSVFAAQWASKLIFKNDGTDTLKDLRVRYKFEGYCDWTGWQKYPEVLPGQTVVSVFYPVLSKTIAELRTNTPADVRVEWKYEDSAGKAKDNDDSVRVSVLGINEFVFSNLLAGEKYGTWAEDHNNAPLLAAWVTRNDPVVKEFAAIANKFAGGVGAGSDPARVMAAIYNLMLVANVTYQHPPGLVDKSVSFDSKFVQNIKLPRDVIKDKSGTCVDLAILYASMANAIGLQPYLVLIQGHCYPAMRVGGKLYAVETTCVGGGLAVNAKSFKDAFQIGMKELSELREGRYFLIDVKDLWTKGVSNPELAALPPDILNRWGLSANDMLNKLARLTGGGGGGGGGDETTDNRKPDPAPKPKPVPKPVPSPFLGSWNGPGQDGDGRKYTLGVSIAQLRNGRMRAVLTATSGNAKVEDIFEGDLLGSVLSMSGTGRTVTDLAARKSKRSRLSDIVNLEVRGGRLYITRTTASGRGGTLKYTLSRR